MMESMLYDIVIKRLYVIVYYDAVIMIFFAI